MINSLLAQNFKSLRSVRVDLQQFTVFVGANGSGKTSILQALGLLCQAFNSEPKRSTFFVKQESPLEMINQGLSRGTKHCLKLVIEADGKGWGYGTASESQHNRHRGARDSSPWAEHGLGYAADIRSHRWSEWVLNQDETNLPPQAVLLRLESSNLIDPHYKQGVATLVVDMQRMAPDGSGMHTALANMALNDPDRWQQLQDDLRQIIPTIRRLRHTIQSANEPPSLLFDTLGADSLPASQVSEGTLVVLGLLTAFHASDRPDVILIDDLDRSLHPKAQRDLITLLRKMLVANPELQILATTHSPYLLDCMDASEVRITYLDNGSTICAKLTQNPMFQKWKDEMHPGELWSMFGEQWVVEEANAT